MKAKIDGKWKSLSVSNSSLYWAEKLKLTHEDIRELAAMQPDAIVACVRRLNGRVHRPKPKTKTIGLRHYQRDTLEAICKAAFVPTAAKGKLVCFSGRFGRRTRAEMNKQAEEIGVVVTTSVDKANAMVVAPGGARRANRARELGLPVLDGRDWSKFVSDAQKYQFFEQNLGKHVELEIPIFHSGGPVTGRATKGPEIQFIVPGRQQGKTEAARQSLVNADFSKIEKRVMANLANKTGMVEAMLGRKPKTPLAESQARIEAATEIRDRIMGTVLNGVAQAWLAAYVSGAIQKLQDQIDEEGAGATMAAAKFPKPY